MALRRKKELTVLIDRQPAATLVTTVDGPRLFERISVLIANLIRTGGKGLAVAGLAHFVAPQPFESLSKVAFPQDTRRWVYQNGLTELLLGLALAFRRTRILGGLGSLVYVAFLASRLTGNASKR